MRVGFVGWRGLVGSVLIQRMKDEGDFDGLECTFYSTSNVGGQVPPERSCHPQHSRGKHEGRVHPA